MCWCATSFRTPLEGVLVYTEPSLGEWEELRLFLEGRGVLYQLVEMPAAERLGRFGTADRPVLQIGASTVVGFDTAALVPLLP
jgi:hypothetical protein